LLESVYQGKLIKKLQVLFPGCVVLKNDPGYLQGVPDLIVLYRDRWAMLEAKANEKSPCRPNQPYYVEKLNEMSFAAFIYPSNEEEVLRALQRSFETRGNARFPEC
jgi:hypothetical protein